MNRKMRKMIKELERRGGIIGMSDDIPDEVAELFLREILDCPECRKAAAATSVDEILTRGVIAGRRGH